MDEYRVAGKTGTAQKADPVTHGYSEKRVASFVGMVPAEDPRLVVLVVIDEPKTDVYGGLVAAPAFKEIAGQALAYLGVPPSRVVPPPAVAAAPAPAKPVASARPAVPEKPVAALEHDVVSDVVEGAVRVPELSGLTGRTAVAQLLGASLLPRLAGSGRVVAQHPAAGSLVDKGSAVTLELAGRLPASP
jgi:cell division protein FtsI (penicillin-binding protein 3)